MPETVAIPAPVLNFAASAHDKWRLEYQAFRRLLPQLLPRMRGQYVAVHGGQVVDSGPDRLAVALRVLQKVGNVPIHVGLVSDELEPVVRSGIRRDLPSAGDAL